MQIFVSRIKDQLSNYQRLLNNIWQSRGAPLSPEIGEQVRAGLLDFYLNRAEHKKHTPLMQLISYELKSVQQGPQLHQKMLEEFRGFIFFGIIGDIALLMALALYFWQSIQKRIESLMETTRRLSKGEDLLPPIRGSDELAMLDLLLHDTASRIIEIQKFKRQLLGVVCHELKAPLSAIQILLSLLTDASSEFSQQARASIDRASRGCNRLQLMVAELLDLETMDSKKVKLNPSRTDVSELLENASETVSAIANDYNVQIVVKNECSEAFVDKDRMLQVLINLLSNAIKFSPDGAQVILSAKEHEEKLEISIQDFGPGIPEDVQGRLFEVFSQGAQPEQQKIKGTGLGLSIARAIAEAHGGAIRIQSRVSEGSTFTVSVPRQTHLHSTELKLESRESRDIALVKPLRAKFSIKHKGIILIGLPLITQIAIVGSLSYFLLEANQELERQTVSRKVVSESQKLIEEMADTAILLFLCGNPPDRNELLAEQFANNKTALNTMLSTCESDQRRKTICNRIEATTQNLNQLHKLAIEEGNKRKLTPDNSPELVQKYLKAWNNFSGALNELTSGEEALENAQDKTLQAIAARLDMLLIVGAAINILSACGLTFFLVSDINKRIMRVQENASRILKKEDLLVPLTGSDEIADLDRAFHDSANDLQKEQEMKQNLLAIASHELRAPLSSIGMSLGMFTQGVYGDIAPQHLKIITQAESACQRLVALINDILDIEKMEAGKFELSLENIQARKLTGRAIACVQPIAEKKNIRIENTVADITLKADPERLIQVLINLITNAIKFSTEGQVVKISSSLNSDNTLRIEIEDAGKGIDQQMQEHIFEQFVKSNEKENTEGTGLGLPIAKAIVEQHGGSIGCESNESKGATFWFSLPMPAPEAEEKAVTEVG